MTEPLLKIGLDVSPLRTGHSHRGIGMYTRSLRDALQELEGVAVTTLLDEQQRMELQSELDLIHYPYFDLFFPSLPLFRSKPSVVTIHDVIPLEFPEAYPVGITGTLSFWKQKLALRGIEHVITDSSYSKQEILRYLPVAADDVSVVPLAGNPNLSIPSTEQIEATRSHYNLPDTYLLYVGDINYNKNTPTLITALAQLPQEVELVCVGRNFTPQPIPEWERIQHTITEHELSDRITFLSDITGDADETISALYAGARAYVQPSLSEGFGLPVVEALQCGTPVVSSDMGSLPEVGGEAVEIVPPTVEGLVKGISTVLDLDTDSYQKRVEQGRAHAATFSWQRTAAETASVYRHVILEQQRGQHA